MYINMTFGAVIEVSSLQGVGVPPYINMWPSMIRIIIISAYNQCSGFAHNYYVGSHMLM